MTDYYEIDFLEVHTSLSGDAIAIRYRKDEIVYINIVDGGYESTGEDLVKHINKHYNSPSYIDNVIVTHPDKDHAEGLRQVLENFTVGTLWILRPWIYASELFIFFPTYNSVDRLASRLRSLYPFVAALEEIAIERGIDMQEPFAGMRIGEFSVLAPSKGRFLDLVKQSKRTPKTLEEASILKTVQAAVKDAMRKFARYVKSAWGDENFSSEALSAENEMSVVQAAILCEQRIMLTADAGPQALEEAISNIWMCGIVLPGIDKFQIPHHGSRRNVTTDLLDSILGQRLSAQGNGNDFVAIVSAAKEDEDHPRKAVVRAIHHRGGRVVTTEGGGIRTSKNAPRRDGYVAAVNVPYPEDQEE